MKDRIEEAKRKILNMIGFFKNTTVEKIETLPDYYFRGVVDLKKIENKLDEEK